MGAAGLVRHVVGSSAIMREQLDKLAGLAREPDVVIQILPFTASDHPGTDGPILVYDFDGASSVAYTECNGGGRIVGSADEVGDLTMIVNMIRAAALPRRYALRSTSPVPPPDSPGVPSAKRRTCSTSPNSSSTGSASRFCPR